jgi:hypothetical protein
MGFYDCRCMLTGVSLRGARAALVPLLPLPRAPQGGRPDDTARDYAPVALAVKGDYDRLGSVDGVEEDDNSRLILRFFAGRVDSGEFAVDEEYLGAQEILDGRGTRVPAYPFLAIEHLLHAFERNINDHPAAARWHDRPVVFALFSRAVWDAVARAGSGEAVAGNEPEPAAPSDLLRRLFGASDETLALAGGIYGGEGLALVAGHLREMAALADLIAGRGLDWRPAGDMRQHYCEEMQQFLDEARRAFADCPAVRAGLDAYEREVGDLIADELAELEEWKRRR